MIVESLHAILKPFLLRRMKIDVEADLPPKKEYVLYAPLTEQQRVMYDAISKHQLRQLLISGKQAEETQAKLTQEQLEAPRKTRGKKSKRSYLVDEDDDEYFEKLENGDDDSPSDGPVVVNGHDEAAQVGREWVIKNARTYILLLCLSCGVTSYCSQEGQQHEPSKHSHATSQR
jgi:ATP-dependent DNA helicase